MMTEKIIWNNPVIALTGINRAVSVRHPTVKGKTVKWRGAIQYVMLCHDQNGQAFYTYKGPFSSESGKFMGLKTFIETYASEWYDTTEDRPIDDIRQWLGLPSPEAETP